MASFYVVTSTSTNIYARLHDINCMLLCRPSFYLYFLEKIAVNSTIDAPEVAAVLQLIRNHCYGGVSLHISTVLRCCRWEVGPKAYIV
ncbi:hypothetical protein Y032_0232g3060 [Ancylostoma ceylanicum]|uniref:Uncharacterized protein n=1 Tax=Ancylostoma ceylanicum TaxID=53326 RepID=A0A016SGM1_9BILA|nr:hypothetical protein Y032_0232g3060 [Ancylostoma ceylanicum]